MLISIVMPVYNSNQTLSISIGSILKQTNPNWELICVDDGSIDNSLELLHQFAIKDTRVKVFHKDNSGPGLTRNFAMKKCVGDYIAYLDSDDYWSENCVDEIIKTIELHDSDIIFLRTIMCYKKSYKDAYDIKRFANMPNKELTSCLLTGVLPWGQEKVIRSSIIRDNNLMFSPDKVGEEAIFSFDAIRLSKVISFISEPMYYYCFYESGQHKQGDLDPWFNVAKKMEAHLKENNVFDEYVVSLNSLALRSLSISIYRICNNFSFKSAKENMLHKFSQYNQSFNLANFSRTFLDKKTTTIYWMLKKHLFFSIYLLSRLRNWRSKK